MSSNGSYPSCSSNNLHESFYCGFTFYLTLFDAKSWANSSLYFALSEGRISSLKLSAVKFSPTKKKAYENEQNKQEIFLYCKSYMLGAPDSGFITTPTFVSPGGTSKGPSSD